MRSASRADDIERFYTLLDGLQHLEGYRMLSSCNGKMNWPKRGVYFFFEPNEFRSGSISELRVVRIGTHALKSGSKTKLWSRLSQHKGQVSGGGNHRGSIFRGVVGSALLSRNGKNCPTWGVGSSADRETVQTETWLEQEVSQFIGQMPFLWLKVDDEPGQFSMRGWIERNSISLLSNFEKEPIDSSSPNWLGNYSDRPMVRSSGLWNSNHVRESYNSQFLDDLEKLIQEHSELL